MDCCLSHSTLSAFLPQSLPFPVKTASSPSTRLSFSLSSSGNFGVGFSFSVPSNRRRPLVVVAASGSQCGKYSGLYTPLELSSDEGLLLSRVLLNNRDHFPKLAKQLLELLACDHRDAVEKMNLCSGSDMAFLRSRGHGY